MFTHGFLGSPLDMAHVCEALAERGFTVAAPELRSAAHAAAQAAGRAAAHGRRLRQNHTSSATRKRRKAREDIEW